MKPDLAPARQLFDAGMKLCRLHADSKRPIGNAWNQPGQCVTEFDDSAHGYGMPLAINGRCSIDPDHAALSVIGMKACGFNLKALADAGCRTASTRPGSGGRSTFKDPGGLKWISFVGKVNGVPVTILELRAESPNLQDVVPGLHYRTNDGTDCTQSYANGRTFLDAPELPADLLRWWRRMSEDHAYQIEQQQKFLAACGVDPVLPHCTGNALPFPIKLRKLFNELHPVEGLLTDGKYVEHGNGRWSPPSATGAPGVRPIPGKDGLWQSDHQSDPLRGTFDAWAAHVILNFGGNADAALAAFRDGEFALEVELADPPPEQVFTRIDQESSGGDDSDREGADTIPVKETPPRPVLQLLDESKPPAHLPGLIRDVMPADSIVMTWGEPGTYKSFIVLGQALSVATNTPWHGHPVKHGLVWYIAGEGHAGLRNRVAAWRKATGVTAPARFMHTPSSVLLDSEDGNESPGMKALLASVEAGVLPVMIDVDTLSRSMSGDENGTKETARYIAALDRLLGAVKAKNSGVLPTVNLVHHSRKDGETYRGSSVLRGAMDVEYEILKKGPRRVDMVCHKYKDDAQPPPRALRAEVVNLGLLDDDFGLPKALTSLVMKPMSRIDADAADTAEQTKRHKVLMTIVSNALADGPMAKTPLRDKVRAEGGVFRNADFINVFLPWAIGQGLLTLDKGKYSKGEGHE